MQVSPTQLLVTIVRLMILIVSITCLAGIAQDRMKRFMKANAVVQRSMMEAIKEPWYEMSFCFGPRLTSAAANLYMIIDHHRLKLPDEWESVVFNPWFQHRVDYTMTIGDLREHRDWFLKHLNWNVDSSYLPTSYQVKSSFQMPPFEHDLSNSERNFPSQRHMFLFHHIMCINYSYPFTFVDETDFVHKITLNNSIISPWLAPRSPFNSDYVDIFVYPKGHMTEYPLIADNVPYRMDMSNWQRLRISAQKILHINNRKTHGHKTFKCRDEDSSYSYVNCLTWCLRRALLRKVKCTIPQLDNFIYNMTAILTMKYNAKQHDPYFRSSLYFNKDTVLPWMTEFLHLPLCYNADDFLDTFNKFSENFFPSGEKRYPFDESCGTECIPSCVEYRVLIMAEGAEERAYSGSQAPSGLTIIYNGEIEVITERWLYGLVQLCIDLSGAMSFLLGLSLMAIHDWCFTLSRWFLVKTGHVEDAPSIDGGEEYYYEDNGFYSYDDYYDYDQYPYDYEEYYDNYQDYSDEDQDTGKHDGGKAANLTKPTPTSPSLHPDLT